MSADTIPTTTCQGCGRTVEDGAIHECYGRQVRREVFALMAQAERRTVADRLLGR